MKKLIIAIALVLLCAVAVQANEVSVTYTDQFRWYGFAPFGREGVVSPATLVDVLGLSLSATGNVPDDNVEELERWDYKLSYARNVGPLEAVLTYGYYNFPDQSSHSAESFELQDLAATVRVLGAISPRLTVVHAWGSNARSDIEAAQLWILGVDLDLGPVNAMAETVFNDGLNPFGGEVSHDWSHLLCGVLYDYQAGDFTVIPGVYYQKTFEESVNRKDDDIWLAVTVKWPF